MALFLGNCGIRNLEFSWFKEPCDGNGDTFICFRFGGSGGVGGTMEDVLGLGGLFDTALNVGVNCCGGTEGRELVFTNVVGGNLTFFYYSM